MNNILLDISGKINASYIDAITEIKNISDSIGIPFFIVGASARDFILEHFYGIKVPRMTTDIDLGMKVVSWEQLNELMNGLIKSGKFKETREKQRISYGDVLIDIVPFGEISNNDFKISWPPDNETIMSVLGFNDAYKYSTTIRLSDAPVLEVKIPTLPGLSILKLLSWKDNYPVRKKDAEDLLFIMSNYENAGNFERLYDTEFQLLEAEKFDNKIACIILLGRDMTEICSQNTLDYIKQIISEEIKDKSKFNLVIDMMGSYDDFDETLHFLTKLKDGIFK